MRRRRLTFRKAATRQYSVYVIQLSRNAVAGACALAPVYVGQTAHTPQERFAQHKAGGMLSAGKAHAFGERLRPDLTAGIGPFVGQKPLAQDQIDAIQAWVKAGMPEGSSRDLPPRPTFTDGWLLGQPICRRHTLAHASRNDSQ